MADTLYWLGRWLAAEPVIPIARSEPKPMTIEVERLPDYHWREVGFPLPRPARE